MQFSVQKRTRFLLSANEVRSIAHINDLSVDEVKATWYSRDENQNFKVALIPLVRNMMAGKEIDETDIQTARGLEYRTIEGSTRRRQNRIAARAAVLDEQNRQIEQLGHVDDELLSIVYCRMSTQCQNEAHQLALDDASAPAPGLPRPGNSHQTGKKTGGQL